MTEERALRIALEENEIDVQWEAQRAESQAEITIAAAFPNPIFSVNREQFFGDPAETEDTVSVEQRLLISGRRRLDVEAARAFSLAVEQESFSQQSAYRQKVRLSFYELLYRQEVVATNRRAVEGLEGAIEFYSQRVDAGESSPYELERLRREQAEYEAIVGEEMASVHNARGELAARLGDDSLDDESLRVEGQLLPEGIPDDEAIRRALSDHPKLAASEHRITAGTFNAESARRWWIPDLLIRGGFKRMSNDGQSFGIEAGLGLSVPLFYRGRGEVDRAQAQLAHAIARRAILENAIEARAMAKARAARQLLTLTVKYETEAVERSRYLFELAEQSYLAGEMSLLEFIDAHHGLVDAELRYLDRAASTRAEFVDLQRLIETATVDEED